MNFAKYYLLFAVWDLFACVRLLDALHILPAAVPFDPGTRMIIGAVILACFFSMFFADKLLHKNLQALNANKKLWVMLGIGLILQFTAGFIRDIGSLSP